MANRRVYNRPSTPTALRLSEQAKRIVDQIAMAAGEDWSASRVLRALIETRLMELGFPIMVGEEAVKLPDHDSVQAWARGERVAERP